MARKIEKMKRVETRRVEIFTLNRETNDEVINFDFDSGIGSERWKITDCVQPFVSRLVSRTRSPLRFESDTLNIEEFKPLYRFEFKRSIWLVSRFSVSKFRLNFPISGTIESLQRRHHRRDETIVMKSRRLIVVNGGASRGQWAGDFDDGTKFLPSGYRGWLIYLGRHTAEHGLRASNARVSLSCRRSRWKSGAIFPYVYTLYFRKHSRSGGTDFNVYLRRDIDVTTSPRTRNAET